MESLIKSVDKFIKKHALCRPSDKVLVGVSGGVDSMVLCHILKELGFSIGIAHVNYKLRSTDSDEDEILVGAMAQDDQLPYHVLRCEEDQIAELKKSNTQEKARDIRYRFFKEIAQTHGYDKVAIAHNLDDHAETLLINLFRGSGIRGLSSMRPIESSIIRPLIRTSRIEIERYAHKNKIQFRTDSSNDEDEYLRNYLRNQVLPLIENRFFSARKRIAFSGEVLQNEYEILQNVLEEFNSRFLKILGSEIIIEPIDQIMRTRGSLALQFHLMKPYNFTFDQITKMFDSETTVGAQFQSDKFVATRDRNRIVISEKGLISLGTHVMNAEGSIDIPHIGTLSLATTDSLHYNTSPFDEIVDKAKLTFPLTIRPWENGDTIQPLGLGGREKKISKLFKDHKLSLPAKPRIPLLCNADGRIIWAIGLQISEAFKIDQNSAECIQLLWTPA